MFAGINIQSTGINYCQTTSLNHLRYGFEEQFGFLMNAFKYGAPPQAGVAFGFDRWVSLFAGFDSIRDTIAFPKNNSGRDVMIDSPSKVATAQLDELHLSLIEPKE